MGHRKDPTPSVHSLSSASEVSTASTSSIHKRSTPKVAAAIIVGFLIISSLAGVTVYFITSEKLLMSSTRNTVVERRIDDLSLYDNQPKRFPNSDILNDYVNNNNIQSSSPTTSSTQIPSENYDLMSTVSNDYEQVIEDVYDDYGDYENYENVANENREYANYDYVPESPPFIGQKQFIRPDGNYYEGRLGIPRPVFNSNIRKIQPGPRFRNAMLRPKHFGGKKSKVFIAFLWPSSLNSLLPN